MKKVLLFVILAVLMAPCPCHAQPQQGPPRISFDFMDADIRNVLRVLAEVSKKNIAIADDVKGKITIKLENVSCDDALEVILRNNDLAKAEDETMIRITTAKRFVEEKDRAAKERVEILREREARQKLEQEFVTETVYVNYADLAEVEKMIRGETAAAATGPAQVLAPGAPPVPEVPSGKPRGLLSPNGVVTPVKWDSRTAGTGSDRFIVRDEERVKWALRRIYYAERMFREQHGSFTDDLGKLGLTGLDLTGCLPPVIKVTASLFEAIYQTNDGETWHIQQDGLVWKGSEDRPDPAKPNPQDW